jgi:O-succinylbenzoate synthase
MSVAKAQSSAALHALLERSVPFTLALRYPFRGTRARQGLLIPGPSGWGEFAPFDDYTDDAASRWLQAALEASFGTWPDPVRDEVPVNAIIPALGIDDVRALAIEATSTFGCSTIKVKITGDLASDEQRVATVREVLDAYVSDGWIRLDVNGAWSTEQALHDGLRLAGYGLDYIEQPTRDLAGLGALRAQVRIAVDEGIRKAPTPPRHLKDVADIAIVKVAPLGGVRRAMDVAEQVGLPIVVSGSMDSSIGLAAGIHAAGCLPELAGACGFGTGALLAGDLVSLTTLPRGGRVPVARREPDMALLAALRPPPEVQQVLRDRLTAAWWAGAHQAWTDPVLAGTAH